MNNLLLFGVRFSKTQYILLARTFFEGIGKSKDAVQPWKYSSDHAMTRFLNTDPKF